MYYEETFSTTVKNKRQNTYLVGSENIFYSNCFLEMVKAKIRDPKIKVTYLPPTINECFCPHWLWSDGKYDYDFGVERYLRWYERLFFKGEIRKRALGFNVRWKKMRIEKMRKKTKC